MRTAITSRQAQTAIDHHFTRCAAIQYIQPFVDLPTNSPPIGRVLLVSSERNRRVSHAELTIASVVLIKRSAMMLRGLRGAGLSSSEGTRRVAIFMGSQLLAQPPCLSIGQPTATASCGLGLVVPSTMFTLPLPALLLCLKPSCTMPFAETTAWLLLPIRRSPVCNRVIRDCVASSRSLSAQGLLVSACNGRHMLLADANSSPLPSRGTLPTATESMTNPKGWSKVLLAVMCRVPADSVRASRCNAAMQGRRRWDSKLWGFCSAPLPTT
mmetsp:Transcript_20756/g.65488  ORF Transcript_20756/g.65488 Transcript_20756/m.65488 type:complete len:269 (+) Transcript_20756:817-1623(+)